MTDLNLNELDNASRLLFTIPLRPLQGDRFQPTGFPSLGAAKYRTKDGEKLLVESVQSMANRLEATCWDTTRDAPIAALDGISHVTVTRGGNFLTDTMLEAHRLNSPYLLEGQKNPPFLKVLQDELGVNDLEPIDRRKLAEVLLKYDVGSLIHGVFLAKSSLAGGRLRVSRALAVFIEATGIEVAQSGGVKNDHIHPGKVTGDSKNHFGNIPFARDEFVADRIDCYVNLDLVQIRGYGLGEKVERLLILLSLHRLRKLLDGDLRLRTACDLCPVDIESVRATSPSGYRLPSLVTLEKAVKESISKTKPRMSVSSYEFNGNLKAAKETSEDPSDDEFEE